MTDSPEASARWSRASDQALQAGEDCVDAVAHEEAHVGGDLLVAAAAGVEFEGEGAEELGELELDEVVDVLGVGVEGDHGVGGADAEGGAGHVLLVGLRRGGRRW